VSSVSGRGFDERRFARGTSSMRRRSMHVVERKDESGSEEPAGAGGGAVEREGRVVIAVGRWAAVCHRAQLEVTGNQSC